MDVLAFFFVLVGLSAVITSVICRHCVARGREPSLWHAVAAAIVSPLVIMLVFHASELFTRQFWTHQFWTDGKAPMIVLLPAFFGFCTLISFLGAAAVVLFYQAGWDDL